MRFPWANTTLLVLVAAQLVTGFAGFLGMSDPYRVFFWAHAIGAYGIVAVLLAKGLIVLDVLRRRPGLTQERVGLALMVVLLLAVLATGLVWITGGPRFYFGYSLINLHAVLAVLLVGLVVQHVLDRRWIVRVPGATDRRAFLRLGAVVAGGVVLWQAERLVQRLLDLPGRARRWTGSYEDGSFTGSFPTTSWFDDDPEPVDRDSWRLVVDGEVERPLELGYDDLVSNGATSLIATLDCTGGWYSRQRWTGVPLARLLETAGVKSGAESVSVESVTGYARRFSLDHARRLILATEVGGRALSHGHGYPLRLVVPDRRGYDWVKWVTHVRVLGSSHLLQPPLPLT
jgi:Oxidoreductase molybdopterin binding domain